MPDFLHFTSKSLALASLFALIVLWTKPDLPETQPDVFIADDISSMMENAKIEWCKKRINCMKVAEALYFESRSEGVKGMQAVANVIMNRAKKRQVSPYDVITRPNQFSYLDRTDFSITEHEVHRTAMLISTAAVTYKLPDITNGSTHYVSPKRLKRIPAWMHTYEKTIAIADHQFYKANM